jgi:hypothetical protein
MYKIYYLTVRHKSGDVITEITSRSPFSNKDIEKYLATFTDDGNYAQLTERYYLPIRRVN